MRRQKDVDKFINQMNMTQYRILLDLHDLKVGRGSNLLLFVTLNVI